MEFEYEKVLSVVVPVYNVALYLECCLESLLAQGLDESEYEVICVDDGSTDSSGQIIADYAEKHGCIKHVYQDNAGVAAARNTGMRHAVGKYIAFVDSDDYLVSGSLKRLLDEMCSKNAEMIVYNHVSVAEGARQSKERMGETRFVKNTSGNPEITTSVCRFLVERRVIIDNEFWFVEGMKYGEDMLFAFYVAMSIDPSRQIICKNKIYCYRQRVGSAIHTRTELSALKLIKDMLYIMDAYKAFEETQSELSDWKKSYIKRRRYVISTEILLCALRSKTIDPYALCDKLKSQGTYPAPLALDTLKRKVSLGNFILLLLRSELIFNLFAKTKILQGR